MSNNNIGAKRVVVGAHYGLKDWLLQRVTAVIMVVFTVVLLGAFLIYGEASYEGWAGLFANQIMKLLTFLALLSLFYHAWVGIRLTLLVLTVLWLLACAGYAAQILWRV